MIIQLEIPKEFENDYQNDRFDDFFSKSKCKHKSFQHIWKL